MNLHVGAHLFCLIAALILGILATFNVPSSRANLFAASWTLFLIAQFFTN